MKKTNFVLLLIFVTFCFFIIWIFISEPFSFNKVLKQDWSDSWNKNFNNNKNTKIYLYKRKIHGYDRIIVENFCNKEFEVKKVIEIIESNISNQPKKNNVVIVRWNEKYLGDEEYFNEKYEKSIAEISFIGYLKINDLLFFRFIRTENADLINNFENIKPIITKSKNALFLEIDDQKEFDFSCWLLLNKIANENKDSCQRILMRLKNNKVIKLHFNKNKTAYRLEFE